MFDPQTIPLASIAGEPALDAQRLQAAWLRQRFVAQLEWDAEHGQEHLHKSALSAPTAASVLVPIVLREQGLTMLLTKRTEKLSSHPGQIAFPGGRVDPGDAAVEAAALREADIPKLAAAACHEAHTGYPVPRYMSQAECADLIRKALPPKAEPAGEKPAAKAPAKRVRKPGAAAKA